MLVINSAMFNKVNKLIFRRTYYKLYLQHNEQQLPPARILYPLENRKLLKVCGTEAAVFLQGLITNDMRHFEDGAKSMYAMFLNNKGRVLYDTLILKSNEENEKLSYLIECDKSVAALLQRHLKLYKLKRKVEIGDASPQFKVWAFVCDPSSANFAEILKKGINLYKDPRLADLGYRILTPVTTKEDDILNVVGDDVIVSPNDKGYKYLRYRLGVSEGADDLPPGTSFPLEANCDYLHGVSFHKGCYIGQEVTARVHHTGVVRKRIMPIRFKEDVEDLEPDSTISVSDKPKSNVGKLKGYLGNCGLGLVRIKEALEAGSLSIGKYPIEVMKPTWWPLEAPKEKVNLPKQEET